MGEYEEEVDDLLDDSDEDDVISSAFDDTHADLLALDDMRITTTQDKTKKPMGDDLLDDDIFPLSIEMDDYDDESDDEAERRRRTDAKKAEAASNKKKRLKILHSVAPGIDLFLGERPGENGFKYFGMADLDLERDFNYSRRSKLVSHGFSEERISEMLTDRLEFVRHLMPEAQTVLICDHNDFQAVMDFLFYSISVCIDRNLSLLMTKAFFDLRRNYGFPWSLTLKHVLTVLLNFGACEEAVYNQVEYRKNLEKHLEAVKRSGQKVKPFELPSLPHFVENKRKKLQEVLEKVVETQEEILDEENIVKENETKPERITAEQFKLCLDSFILLLTDFSAGQPSYAEFREKNNWSDKLILIYLLLVMGTDKRLIRCWRIREAITFGLHYHLDSFKSSEWYWGPHKKEENLANGKKVFNFDNVHKSVAIMVNDFFPGQTCPAIVTWDTSLSVKNQVSFGKNSTSDHHLNMLARINLIPASQRGNQLKKYLSFMYLQTIAEIAYRIPEYVDVFDIQILPELCSNLSLVLKAVTKIQNYEVIMTLVELYDNIVGHEPSTDFTEDKVAAIDDINRNVLQWIQKKLPNMNRINTEDDQDIKGVQLSEFLHIVQMRWKTHMSNRR